MTPVDSSRYANSGMPDAQHPEPLVSIDEEDSGSKTCLAYKYPPRSHGKKKRKKSLSRHYIFVLWGSQFDEIAATIFITQLRDAGLRVKVVSPVREKLPGEFGVGLYSDYTIERALRLMPQVVTVVIPCGLKGAKMLQDPRFFELFEQAHLHKAKFFISDMPNAELKALDVFPPSMQQDDFVIYPEHKQLIEFVRQMPHWLPYMLA